MAEGDFVSYVLDNFVIYRTPEIVPIAEEKQDEEDGTKKTLPREHKGQGEFELPSAVYIERGLTQLGRSPRYTI
jgi:hypothetical protein